ncbi:hypothetical protein CH276_14055 [Rhodococcus sp. 06-470-2]|uniref:hypothetical protein n=1 Tax=unclassified Rhodococcus (in: high G+C Gram-positive bacteria) TaxID=192944 RepID=UPI000B9C4AF5|nr:MULTISPECIES: hypothetical protein [unclassified Rhodococcus (in: high G+C Gram-positive bacteria)]OZC62740.1 hypothetical protein CH276_14055 [Rhodococcus sp. 06-470-2]OZE71717.1 hypothetical protein CH265_01535 [Rhodococcus sp. 05-2221-1B]
MTAALTVTVERHYDAGPDLPPTIIASGLVGKLPRTTRFNPNLYPDPIGRARHLAKVIGRANGQSGKAFSEHWTAIADELEKVEAEGGRVTLRCSKCDRVIAVVSAPAPSVPITCTNHGSAVAR